MKRFFNFFWLFALIIVLLSLCSTTIFAQQQEEMVTIKKSDLTQQQLDKIQQKDIQDKISKLGFSDGLGHEVGTAVNESLKAFTDSTLKIADSKVGKITIFLVAAKVLGPMVTHMFVGLLFFLVVVTTFTWSYWKTCIPRKILVNIHKDKDGKPEKIYEIINNNGHLDERRAAHGFLFAGLLLVSVAVTFCFS